MNNFERNVYYAMIEAQNKFPESSDEWVELELIISDYAYKHEDQIWPKG